MVDQDLLNACVLTQTIQNTFNLKACLGEGILPGAFLVASHIVGGMVTGNDHQRQQDDLGSIGSLNSCQNIIQRRCCFYGADEVVSVPASISFCCRLA